MASVEEQARYRVTNPTERALGWHYDSVRYVVEPQSSVVLSDVVAQHLKKYHDALELTPVEAVYQDAGSPAPAVYACPSVGCGFSCNEFPAFHAHIAEHMAPRAAEPAGKAKAEVAPVAVLVTIGGETRPAVQLGAATASGKVKVRLEDGTEVSVPKDAVHAAN